MNTIKAPVYLDEKLAEINRSGRLHYRSKALPTWCPGCGYFAIVEAITVAFKRLSIAAQETVVVSGIGCASRFPFFVDTYGFHTLHGRVLPVATGIKVANEKLTVIAIGGDGDGFAIGGGHIPHAARRNVDITYILFDNGIYGLTKDLMAAMREAGKIEAPGLGVFFKAPRPTLGDGLNEIGRRARGEIQGQPERRAAGM